MTAERTALEPCPHCGCNVSASYMGSSDWEVNHLDEHGVMKEHSAECVDVTIYARASSADWDRDPDAEWNMMAAKWNRRQPALKAAKV